MYKEIIEENINNFYNVRDEYKSLDVENLQSIAQEDTFPFRVCAVNVEGDLNVGMMIRSASLLGAEKFYVFGRRKIDNRSMVGAQNYLPIERVDGLDGNGNIDYLKFKQLCQTEWLFPVMIETGGPTLDKIEWDNYFNMTGNYTLCLIFGNESSGLSKEFIDSPIPRISIPQRGVMRSFNVSAAASIVMWDMYLRYFNVRI